jgi:hypothetical protein
MSVREDIVLDKLAEYVEANFIPEKDQNALWSKAKRGQLTESDLPAGFKKLKRLLVAKLPSPPNPERVKKELAPLTAKLERDKRNLIHLDPEFIPGAQEELRAMEKQRQALLKELQNQPTETDLNQDVCSVLTKLFWLGTLKPNRIEPVLREVDHITVVAKAIGRGHGARYEFHTGNIHFKAIGVVTGKLNPHRSG